MENLLHPALIWFIIGVAMLILESMMPGLVIMFFGIGAWVVAILALLVDISLNAQLGIFIVASLVSLVLFRKMFTKIFSGHKENEQNPGTDLDEFVGAKAVVKETVSPVKSGKVELNGTLWNAEADEEIQAGATVKVVHKNNLTLKVKKL